MSKMMWKPFEELFLVPLRNGLTRPKSVRGNGVKMINMGEIFAYSRIGNISMDRVPLSENEAKNFLLEKKDLLFARQSLVLAGAGKCAIVIDISEETTWESHIIRARLNPEIADSEYYYYFFNSKLGRQAIESIVEQVAAAGIRGSDLAKLRVPYPPLSEQRAIAYILGSLDDKIELNRQMNETLEAMARALFKDWFVDFGPVRAKMAGQQPPGLATDIAALFPDALDDQGKPVGWKMSQIGDEVRVVGGATPNTKEVLFWDGGTNYWVTPKDLSKLTSPVLLSSERKITDAGLAQISSRLLPIGTVLLSSRAPIGYLAITEVRTAINQGFIALICEQELPNLYILFWCKENMESIIGNANGSTFQEISKTNFRPLPVLVPSREIVWKFIHLVEPVFRKIVVNLQEMKSLEQLRDLLLPRLLSGELRVKDFQQIIEDTL